MLLIRTFFWRRCDFYPTFLWTDNLSGHWNHEVATFQELCLTVHRRTSVSQTVDVIGFLSVSLGISFRAWRHVCPERAATGNGYTGARTYVLITRKHRTHHIVSLVSHAYRESAKRTLMITPNKRIIGKNVSFRYRSLTFVGHVLPPAFGSPKFPTAVESRAIPNIRTWPLPRLLSSWISQLYQSRWEPVGTFVHVGYIDTYIDEEMSICSTTFSHWRHVRSVP